MLKQVNNSDMKNGFTKAINNYLKCDRFQSIADSNEMLE